MLKFSSSKPAESKIDLFHWRPSKGGENFGDHLSHVVVSQLLARHERLLDEVVREQRRLLAIGSILHFAQDNDVVWGSGINGKVPVKLHKFKNLDVRAVRGPLSRKFLLDRGISVPEIYGDPALLLPSLFPTRFSKAERHGISIVPNLHDVNIVKGHENLISPLLPWHKAVDAISRSEFVISSSLHGLIIAEAFGIPARYVRLSETESLFKYEDYYQGTGRYDLTPARTIPEALEMGGMPAPIFDADKLLNAFPLDIWA